MSGDTIDNNFMHHIPKEGQSEKYDDIRSNCKDLARKIDATCPNSREKSCSW